MVLIVIVIGGAVFLCVKKRRERSDFAHKKFGGGSKDDNGIVKKKSSSPSKGRSLTFDPPVMFMGNYVKIDKQKDGKDKDTEGILDQAAYDVPELSDGQL